MAVAKTVYKKAQGGQAIYVLLTGTVGEVMQQLADDNVNVKDVAVINAAGTLAVYFRG